MTTPRRKTTILERTYQADLDDVWALWTTKEGLESWWGPDGFTTKVRTLELRAGGLWEYLMTATGQAQVDFMKGAGMPLSTTTRANYTEVLPKRRLGYDTLVDFIPGIAPYTAAVIVTFEASGSGARISVALDAMHDEHWTDMARRGWESQLGRLAEVLNS